MTSCLEVQRKPLDRILLPQSPAHPVSGTSLVSIPRSTRLLLQILRKLKSKELLLPQLERQHTDVIHSWCRQFPMYESNMDPTQLNHPDGSQPLAATAYITEHHVELGEVCTICQTEAHAG